MSSQYHRYILDQQRMFARLDAMERREQMAAAQERQRVLQARWRQIDALKPQLWKLGQLVGMSFSATVSWAESLIQQAKALVAHGL